MSFSYDVVKEVLDQAYAKSGNKFLPFDAEYYLANYSVVSANGVVVDDSLKNFNGDPLEHYVLYGAAKGYSPNAVFDAAFYQAKYADVAGLSGADLLVHYARFGVYEGRSPNAVLAGFDGARYLAEYPDVAKYVNANLVDFLGSATNGAIAHYVLYGAAEERLAYTLDGVSVTNEAPTTADATLDIGQSSAYVFKASDFPFSDPDAGDTLCSVVITRLPGHGTLSLNGVVITSLSSQQSQGGGSEVGTTVTAAQLASGGLVFTPEEGYKGEVSFGFKVKDLGLESRAAELTLTSPNHAPTTADGIEFVDSAKSVVLTLADFKFEDVDGDTLASVTITSLPSYGILQLNGYKVTSEQIKAGLVLTAEQITSGVLKFWAPFVADWEGVAKFGFTVSDGAASSAEAVVKIAVGNVAPTTESVLVRIEEDQSYVFKLADFPWSDLNPKDVLTKVDIASVPASGQLLLNGEAVLPGLKVTAEQIAAGQLSYVPATDFNGNVSFSFKVADAQTESSAAVFGFSVGNRAPGSDNALVTGKEDVSYLFAQRDFPFADADGDALQKIQITTLPKTGTLTLNGKALAAGSFVTATELDSGALSYVPGANANGKFSFGFKVFDELGSSAESTMTINLAAVNDAPLASASSVLIGNTGSYALKAADFAFSDVDGDTLAYVKIVSLPASGTLTLGGVAIEAGATVTLAQLTSGQLVYAPVADFNGKAAFSFLLSDGQANSNQAVFSLAVGNQPPVTEDGSVQVATGATRVFTAGDFAFHDVNGDSLAAVIIDSLPATGGQLLLNGVAVTAGAVITAAQLSEGKFSFVPAADFSGQLNFAFRVQDQSLSSNAAHMTLSVGNHAPVTADASTAMNEDTSHVFSLSDFPFTDADGDALVQVQILSLPVNGTLTLDGVALKIGAYVSRAQIETGHLSFAPTANFSGNASFSFKVFDALDGSNAATLNMTVNAVNEVPTTANVTLAGKEDTTYSFKAADFPFKDGDGDALATVVIDSLPTSGSLQLKGLAVKAGDAIKAADLGLLSYVPVANANGNVQFAFHVTDAESSSSRATLTISLEAVEDAPLAKASSVTAQAGKSLVFSASQFGFSDADGDALQSVKIVSLPASGELLLNGSAVKAGVTVSAADLAAGKLSYTLDGLEKAGFSFAVSDGLQFSDAATMSIAVDSALTLVSHKSTGASLTFDSIDPEISADGRYVVFTSSSSGLADGDGNVYADVYLSDMQTGTTTLISACPNPTAATNGASGKASISADGRVIAFSSLATTFVSGDTNDARDIFVYDTSTKTLKLASSSAAGVEGNGSSDQASVSGDGHYVAFTSTSSNLAGSTVNPNGEIFVKNLSSGAVSRASAALHGEAANGASNNAVLSNDGSVVAFDSYASNLVANDSNGFKDVFIRVGGVTTLVSSAADGTAGNSISSLPQLTFSGDKIAFTSLASNLVSGDTNGVADVFLKDLTSGSIVCISESSTGAQANGGSTLLSISSDGHYVAFYSTATNLVANDTNGKADLFVKDTVTGNVILVSVSDAGVQGNGDTKYADLSADGSFISFASEAKNLVATDTNSAYDVFWGALGG